MVDNPSTTPAYKLKFKAMNKIETHKIADKLKSIGFNITNTDTDILWHGEIIHHKVKNYKDNNKNTYQLRDYALVSFEAGINKAGVGDGKKPDKALTYSINYHLSGNVRNYRSKTTDYNAKISKFYGYSRNLDELFNRFIKHLIIN